MTRKNKTQTPRQITAGKAVQLPRPTPEAEWRETSEQVVQLARGEG
jgi:hypothetical protein